jgi:hypothetical protein
MPDAGGRRRGSGDGRHTSYSSWAGGSLGAIVAAVTPAQHPLEPLRWRVADRIRFRFASGGHGWQVALADQQMAPCDGVRATVFVPLPRHNTTILLLLLHLAPGSTSTTTHMVTPAAPLAANQTR